MSPVREISVEQVLERLRQDGRCRYLDVRTVHEFEQARPAGAYNVPLLQPDPSSGQALFNAEFPAVVVAVFELGSVLLCGCATGVRSFQAVQLLHQIGYREAFSVRAGFCGKHDPLGRVIEPGWAECGLPVESGDAGDRSYAALRERAGLADG